MSDAGVSDVVQAMAEINSYYQDIEITLAHDMLTMPEKLARIAEINKQIGEITKEWI